MGKTIIQIWEKRIKKEWKIAFTAAFFIGMAVHLFRFTNAIPNADALYNFYNSQNMVGSGRWFLSVACGLSGYFDIPWLIGLLSLLFMALTAVVVIEVFEMDNPVLIVLSSGLLVSFPSITETMWFEFTADGYMMAMLLAAVSVLVTKIRYRPKIKDNILTILISAVCICLSCAIYQAYVSFAMILAICYYIGVILEGQHTLKEYVRWIVVQVFSYAIGLIVYYVIWKLCILLQGYQESSYGGINEVGTISIQLIKNGIHVSVMSLLRFFFEEELFTDGVTLYSGLNLLFILMLIGCGINSVIKSRVFKKKVEFVLMILCVLCIPFAACIWSFTSVRIEYSSRMLQSLCVLYIFGAWLFEKWVSPRMADLVAVLLAVIICNNSVTANTYYLAMEQCFDRSYATAVEMNTRIHMLDDGTAKYIAVVGEITDYPQYAAYQEDKFQHLGVLHRPTYSLMKNGQYIPIFLSTYTDFALYYYVKNDLQYPIVDFGSDSVPAPKDWVFRFPVADPATQTALENSQEVAQMPVWPMHGAVKVIEDTIVIKIAEVSK